ncbi:MAG TPA: A24 family peptidase [Acetivibrio sp.]|jgi:prepilin signal peptidase PulO-like enzyme (type II secretory pathway)|nr:A24 family peptidase [Acetivibrio sp.]
MWTVIAIPLALLWVILSSGYLQKEVIAKKETLKDKALAFFPRKPLYLVALTVVLIMGIMSFGFQYYFFSDYIKAAKLMTLVMMLAPIAYIDFNSMRIPNELLLGGLLTRVLFYVIEILANNKTLFDIFLSDMAGVLLGGGAFLLGALIAKNGIGMGDAKMFAVIGIYCGYTITMTVMVFSLFLCFVSALVLLILRKKGRKDTIPFAPFVFIGTFLTVILGSY